MGMSDKKAKSFTLEPENAELCDELDNASAVVDDLLTQYRQGADKETVAIDLQIQQKERELRNARRDVERLESDLAELKELKAQMNKREDAKLQDAQEALEGVPREATNPAIENWAEQLGMTPQELLNKLD